MPGQPGVDYPSGPYGFQVGSRIANLELTGQRDSNNSGLIDSSDEIVSIHLSDYYMKQYKALFVGVAAQWCNPCKMEQPGLVSLHAANKSNVGFVEAIIQKNDGSPADITTVDQWTSAYKIPFDMAADPTVALGPYYAEPAFPMQLVIDTKDMTIVFQGNGTSADLETMFQGIFDGI